MIDANDVREHLIDRLATIFGSPKSADGLAAELARQAPGHATSIGLGALAQRLIETRRAKGFPSASELIAAVKAMPAGDASASTAAPKFGVLAEEAAAKAEREAIAKARAILHGTDLAARAVRDRWAPGLFGFVRQHGHLPDSTAEKALIAEARTNDAIARENRNLIGGGVYRLREVMHWRAARDMGFDVPLPDNIGMKPRRGTYRPGEYVPQPPEPQVRQYEAADLAPSPELLATLGEPMRKAG